jgi:bifunctional DNA-binding transcriptional regulator/antitoxin component of YhaV-PrlF toxin-antitoxin module
VAFATHFFVEVNGMQKEMVFKRPIDNVGRLVIPIDIRRMYGIGDKDTLCIIPLEEGFLIRKDEE